MDKQTAEKLDHEFTKAYRKIRGIELAQARQYAANDTEYRQEIEADREFFNAGFQRGLAHRKQEA